MTDKPRYFGAKLFAGLYPFTVAALAINLFMLGLLCQALGMEALTPTQSLIASMPLGLPVNWLVTRWVKGLLDEAER